MATLKIVVEDADVFVEEYQEFQRVQEIIDQIAFKGLTLSQQDQEKLERDHDTIARRMVQMIEVIE